MRTARMIALTLGAILLVSVTAPPARADVDVSFGFFYSNLEPHGSWLVSAQYGRVWQPSVYSVGWNPYYDGHWACSDLGWAWVSDYSWGAVPYHYGTWVLDPRFGWVWVPGYTWAPSWVVFRTGPDYIGWAPVPPSFSIGASFAFGDDPDMFVMVGAREFMAPRVRTHVVPVATTRTVFRSTTFVNNIRVENDVVVNRGPDVRFVERASGKRVRVEPIERVARVAPAARFTKTDLRVRKHNGGSLRAAMPVSKDEPIPQAKGRPRKVDRGPYRSDRSAAAPSESRTIDAQRGNRIESRELVDRGPRGRERKPVDQTLREQQRRRSEATLGTRDRIRNEQQAQAEREARVKERDRFNQSLRQQERMKGERQAQADSKAKKKAGSKKSNDKKSDDKKGESKQR